MSLSAPSPTCTTIKISSIPFPAPDYFSPGEIVSESDAPILNSALHSLLRSRFSAIVRAAAATTESPDLNALTATFNAFAENLLLSLSRRPRTRTPVDPIRAASIKIATTLIRKTLRTQSIKKTAKEVRALAIAALEKPSNSWIIDQARILSSTPSTTIDL